jgi:hypothetical protein
VRRGGICAGSLADALAGELERRREAERRPPTFREFLEDPEYAGPYMEAIHVSPAILAIAEASEGAPVTAADDALCAQLFHCARADMPVGRKPRTVVVNAGRRGGKTSNLLAPKAVHAAWTVPLPNLRKREIARAVIISSEVDLAEAAFNYCKGIVEASPRLSRALEKPITAEQILLRRPDGHLVEIVVGAATRGGTAARSRTLVFVGLDEAAFMRADDGEHSVTDRDIYEAAKGTVKVLQGAQIWVVSTPWIEGDGLMEELIEKHWGKPGNCLVAARISSYLLRGIPDDGSLLEEDDDEDTYRREILSIPMPPGSVSFFSSAQITAALKAPPPEGPPDELGAGGDFAFDRDCAAVATVGRWLGGWFAPTLIRERPASPHNDAASIATVREFGRDVRRVGCTSVMIDHHRRPFVAEHLAGVGVAFAEAPGGQDGKVASYGALKRIIEEGRFVLTLLPQKEAEYTAQQLRSVTSVPLTGGGWKIIATRVKRTLEGRTGGKIGAHGDVVSALVLAAWVAGAGNTAKNWGRVRAPHDPLPTPAPVRGKAAAPELMRSRSAGLGLRPGQGRRRRDDDDD